MHWVHGMALRGVEGEGMQGREGGEDSGGTPGGDREKETSDVMRRRKSIKAEFSNHQLVHKVLGYLRNIQPATSNW